MTSMRTHAGILVVLVAAALAGAGCGETPAPDRPTYSRDIQPLMTAHCIRCHGAGGTLNKDPDSALVNSTQQPTGGDFTALSDDAAGKHGLTYYATDPAGKMLMSVFLPQMPPTPAPALTDREFTILTRWLSNPL